MRTLVLWSVLLSGRALLSDRSSTDHKTTFRVCIIWNRCVHSISVHLCRRTSLNYVDIRRFYERFPRTWEYYRSFCNPQFRGSAYNMYLHWCAWVGQVYRNNHRSRASFSRLEAGDYSVILERVIKNEREQRTARVLSEAATLSSYYPWPMNKH